MSPCKMRANKRVLKCKIEEDDKKQVTKDEFEEGDDKRHTIKVETEEDDDEMHGIKDETNGEALEHHGHPQDKAISLDDQIQEEEPEPRGMSLNSGTSSRSTAPPEEQRRLPCERCFRRMIQHPDHVCVLEPGALKCERCRSSHETCFELPSALHVDVIRALSMHPEKRRIALIRATVRRMQRSAAQPRRVKSTYGSTYESSDLDVPPCPRSYHTPMTNDLRNHGIQSIKAVRDEIQAVSDRTQWEVRKLTERLIEVETEMQDEMQDEEGLSAWL